MLVVQIQRPKKLSFLILEVQAQILLNGIGAVNEKDVVLRRDSRMAIARLIIESS